jgi:hypothetical protein
VVVPEQEVQAKESSAKSIKLEEGASVKILLTTSNHGADRGDIRSHTPGHQGCGRFAG